MLIKNISDCNDAGDFTEEDRQDILGHHAAGKGWHDLTLPEKLSVNFKLAINDSNSTVADWALKVLECAASHHATLEGLSRTDSAWAKVDQELMNRLSHLRALWQKQGLAGSGMMKPQVAVDSGEVRKMPSQTQSKAFFRRQLATQFLCQGKEFQSSPICLAVCVWLSKPFAPKPLNNTLQSFYRGCSA